MMLLVINKPKKIGLVIGLSMLITFCVLLFWSEFKMNQYKITCAKCIHASRTKSNWYYKLEYQVGNKSYISLRQGRNYNDAIANYIDTVKCIKIAYSQSDVGCIRILDEKIANEWLWFLDEKDR